MLTDLQEFTVSVPQQALDDLASRLQRVRWPEAETVDDWSQGVPIARMRALVDYWATRYDWRAREAKLNALPQYKTEIDGLGIHFLHIRSPRPDALPLVLTHGWPGSVLEFLKVTGPLSDPVAHSGSGLDAFHLVIPSLPGYGFSDKPASAGWGLERIARAWDSLMQRLGYDRYAAQGGDWGSAVTMTLARLAPPGLLGVHVNFLNRGFAGTGPTEAIDDEEREIDRMDGVLMAQEGAYAIQQATRPQTLGYGLADSPVGQAAWIYEKFARWTDSGNDPEGIWSRDEILDAITLYWLSNSATSSARLYWENRAMQFGPIAVPFGHTQFPGEISRISRRWAEQTIGNIIHWNKASRGGHFAAWEQPEIFVTELRECFRKLRGDG